MLLGQGGIRANNLESVTGVFAHKAVAQHESISLTDIFPSDLSAPSFITAFRGSL